MLKQHPFLVFIIVLLMASLACSQATPVPPPDPNALNTSIAQTVAARQTEAVLTNPPTATNTSVPSTPTLTLEPTLSVTPDFTPTLETPLITVSVDTNCRTGPGAIFQQVGILLVGETAEVVGREPKGEYWYIRNPDEDPEYCWVWGEYASLTGNLLPLLFVSPPPPPAVQFSLVFTEVDRCDTTRWVKLKLVNMSGVIFQSISVFVSDTDTLTNASQNINGFPDKNGCGAVTMVETLVPGGTVTISSPPFGYDISKHKLVARVTACTSPDQKGTCLTQEINFIP